MRQKTLCADRNSLNCSICILLVAFRFVLKKKNVTIRVAILSRIGRVFIGVSKETIYYTAEVKLGSFM